MLVICNPKKRFNIIMLNIDTTRADIIFKPIPAFIISLISNCPLPKITALGGVAIGNINAQLAAIVVGMTKNKGFISKPIAKIINIGVKVATVAVFELSSVKKIINKTAISIKA